jgi:hypothetical protein
MKPEELYEMYSLLNEVSLILSYKQDTNHIRRDIEHYLTKIDVFAVQKAIRCIQLVESQQEEIDEWIAKTEELEKKIDQLRGTWNYKGKPLKKFEEKEK